MNAIFAFLLIVIGVLILGENLSWWQGIDFATLFALWPLILIVLGASLISRRFKYGTAIPVIVALACAIFALVALINPELIGRESSGPVSDDGYSLTKEFDPELEQAKVHIVTGATKLSIDGKSDNLIDVEATSGFNGVTLDQKISGSIAELKLSTDAQKRWRFGRERDMGVSLNPLMPYELDLDAGASDVTMDLSELIINGLQVDAGAATLDITIGALVKHEAQIDVKAGAASIDIRIPEPIGVKIISRSGLASTDFGDYEKINDSEYQSKNYAQATKKINLNIEVGASSVRVLSY